MDLWSGGLRKPITKTLIITAWSKFPQVPYASFESTKMVDQLGGRSGIARLEVLSVERSD
jgi:hypothetical protein